MGPDVVRLLAPLFDCDARFNTYCFILFFLPVVLVGYWAVPARRWKLGWLTAASLVFYSLWDWRFAPLLVVTAVVDYFLARKIHDAAGAARKRWMVLNVCTALASLGFFKYAMFAADNANGLLALLGTGWRVPDFAIILPIGISFFTFHSISYAVDVYRRDVPATRDFGKYLCYMTMFPQLVAGPIVRYAVMDKQLDELPRGLTREMVSFGLTLFVIGLFKKLALADTLGAAARPVFDHPEGATFLTAWAASFGYTLQLYFDFSGYSDMAIGLGALLGLRFPINFDAPYQALNPSDFWRRWHISLSTFLRDYLYIPLGGNRHGEGRTKANLLVVMALGGFWHGANWTFVVWGFYHGFLLVAYRQWGGAWDRMPVPLQQGLMFLLAVLGWVVFRADSLGDALVLYRAMVLPAAFEPAALLRPVLLFALGLYLFVALAKPSTARLTVRPSVPVAVAVGSMLVVCMVLIGAGSSPFLYYQF